MPSSGPSRLDRPLARNLGGNPGTTTVAGTASTASQTAAPLFPDSPAPQQQQRFTVSSAVQWSFLGLAVVAGLALLFMRYYRLRRQGGAVTWRQIFSRNRSHQPANQTHGRTYPRSRPSVPSSFGTQGYPLPPDMFLPARPPRAAERGAAGETIGPGGRRDVAEESEDGMELPAYESARKTGLPAYNEDEFRTVPELSHMPSTSSFPPPSLGRPVEEVDPPPPLSQGASAAALVDSHRPSTDGDPFSESTRTATRPA